MPLTKAGFTVFVVAAHTGSAIAAASRFFLLFFGVHVCFSFLKVIVTNLSVFATIHLVRINSLGRT